MAQYENSAPQPTSSIDNINIWAVGFIFFASMMMMLLGSFHFIIGLAALFDDSFYHVHQGFSLGMDTTTWGGLQIVFSVILMITGLALLTGSLVARVVAIVVVAMSGLVDFYSIPYYPVWSILTFVMCIGVLWALIFHGRELAET